MLQEPPLSEPALVLWKTYIAEWTHPHRRTRKREAAEALTNFVTVLLSSGARARDDFARWLFSSVVDYHADLPIQSQLVEEVLAPYVSRTIEQSGDSEDIVTVALGRLESRLSRVYKNDIVGATSVPELLTRALRVSSDPRLVCALRDFYFARLADASHEMPIGWVAPLSAVEESLKVLESLRDRFAACFTKRDLRALAGYFAVWKAWQDYIESKSAAGFGDWCAQNGRSWRIPYGIT